MEADAAVGAARALIAPLEHTLEQAKRAACNAARVAAAAHLAAEDAWSRVDRKLGAQMRATRLRADMLADYR